MNRPSAEKDREKLNDLSFDKSLGEFANFYFRRREKEMRKTHPEFFVEEDLQWGNSNEAIIRRLEERLESLSAITDSMQESSRSLERNLRACFDNVISKNEQINSHCEDQVSHQINNSCNKLLQAFESNKQVLPLFKPAPLWPWFIVIGLLIVILWLVLW